MDQIYPQNEHIDIKTVANSHVGVTLKIRQKRPKIHVFLRHTFFVKQFLGNYHNTPAYR